ncbi:MAG: hypothetical protein GXO66_02610 [Euryarchaeota archaeon]|nr:hypothetical protein [Euryarchaeota archaeon]
MNPGIEPFLKIAVGLVLILIAPRIVGALLSLIGAGFILIGAAKYYLGGFAVTLEAIFPVVIGLIIIFVGKSMAEAALRIAGLVAIVWGVWDLGLIGL